MLQDQPQPGRLLWSSFLGEPAEQFVGYCFVGSDFIESETGMQNYVSAGGERVGPGEDGTYVSVTKDGESTVIGTDHAGWHRLFYFHDGHRWAVADSVARLVAHLADQGVTLAPQRSILASQSWNHTLVKQVSTFSLGVEGVRLLPSWCYVHISGARMRIVPREPLEPRNFREILDEFLDIWIARVQTILEADLDRVTIDVTGGADSRSVLALVLAATRASRSSQSRVTFQGWRGPYWESDWVVSKGLARQVGFPLVGTDASPRTRGLGLQDAYDQWYNLCAGVYRPIYAPISARSMRSVSFQGGAGENYRRFYRPDLYRRLADRSHRWVPRTKAGEVWYDEVLNTISLVGERYPGLDPTYAHYREFRGRLHSGRFSLYQCSIAPLVSKYLTSYNPTVLGHCGAKLNFDIMENLVPGLSSMPYNDPAKAPTPDTPFDLLGKNLRRAWNPGTSYLGPRGIATDGAASYRIEDWIELLSDDFKAAYRPEVIDISGQETARSASKVLAKARIDGGFFHETDAMDISAMIGINSVLRYEGC